jgi:PAS domain S-box-containing protein
MAQERIITSPTIANGEPVIRNTQIPVHEVLACAATSRNLEEVVYQFPGLELADVKAALEYAATVVRQQAKSSVVAPAPVDEVTSEQEPVELDLKKILVVDDTEANRLLIQAIFRNSNFELSMASDGVEGLAKARAELPFLIISDIQMPGLSGLQLLMELKADERTKNVGVIFVTAHRRDSQQVSQGLTLGADDYIALPFKRDEFLARVGAVMRLKWAEAEARRQARVVARRNKGLELVNELALAVNSSLDLQEIFASSIQKLSQLLDAEAVSLILLNEERKELEVDVSSRTGKGVSTSVDFQLETEMTSQTVEEQVPVIVSKILGDLHLDLDIDLPADTSAIKCIPMISKEQIIGAIAIVTTQGRDLAATDKVLLNSAAGIIAVAVENAHLLQHTQRQVDDLIVLTEIGHALTSTLNLEQILKQTTRLVRQTLEAEAASLWLLDEQGQELVLTASSGLGAEAVAGFRMPVREGIAGHVIQTGEPYISIDLSRDEKYFGQVPEVSYQPGSMLCVPLRVKGQIMGVMQALHRHLGWFDQNHLRLFSSVASSVGIAIENAHLFGEVQDFSRHLEQMVAERTRELAEEKEKTEAILASMADGLLVLDAEKRILTANTVAEGMLDFRLNEWQGKPIGSEQLENSLWLCISEMADSIEPTVSALVDIPSEQTGAVLSIQAHSARVQDEAGQTIGTVIVLRDITALKEVERMKARFMAGVTHELKTPLSIIGLHAKNLLNYHARMPEQKRNELLHAVQAQVKLLEKLIESILELSRLDASMIKSQREPLNLATLTEQVVADLAPLAEEKQIALAWQKPTTEITILVDPGQMERVIRNLIDNAIKYTQAGGSVEVQIVLKLIDDRAFVSIRITDTGIGIPAEHQSRVFDRFYRVDPSHTIPGTGLGLSIVKEIVDAYNGEVRLESMPGEGSTFTVTLPGFVEEAVNVSGSESG